MKTVTVLFIFCAMAFAACKNNSVNKQASTAPADTAKFYPLRSFFKEQIQYVDLRNFNIYQTSVKDGKKDSISITKEVFALIAARFLEHDISAPPIKIQYQESVFHDLSTGSVTLNYKPNNPDAIVQNIDILLDEETNLVKRVFIRAAYNNGDTSFAEQYNWKANKSFQINRTISAKNGYHSTELNYINWNDKP